MNDEAPDTMHIEGFPLSPQQRRIWRLGNGDRSRAVVFVEGILEAPEVAEIEEAAHRVVARHEILRTGFELLPGAAEPLQVIHDRVRFEFLRPAGDGDSEADREALAECLRRPFDMASGAPLRLGVLSLADGGAHLAVALPALCADRRSLALLIEELLMGGSEEILQYADFAEWQNQHAEEEEGDPSGSWRQISQLLEEPVELPLERRDERDSSVIQRIRRRWSGGAVALAALAEASGGGLEAVTLAAWTLLLRRLSGRAEMVPVIEDEGRPFDELEQALGAFAKYLPPVSPPSFEAPFGRHVEWAAAELAQLREVAAFYSLDRLEDRHLPWGFAWIPGERARSVEELVEGFAVRLVCGPAGDALDLALEYDGGRMPTAVAELVLDRLIALLSGAHGDTRGHRLPWLGEGDHRRFEELNDTEKAVEPAETLHGLVLDRFARTPSAIALASSDGRTMTCGELREEVYRLAAHLHRLGVKIHDHGRRDRVAVLVERGPEMVTALIAVLLAGGTLVPLDPEYPRRRLAGMMADANASILITTSQRLAVFTEEERPPQVVLVDEDREAILAAPDSISFEPPVCSPETLAYVIYTSGSTGQPKGVMVPHRAIVNRIRWMITTFPFRVEDRILLKTPSSFDASLWELFVPLAVGARLVLARSGGHRDPSYLARTVASEGITVLQLVPSLLRPFLSTPELAEATSLRYLFCGGEALPVELCREVEEKLPEVHLHNLYGPTETAIDSTHQPWDGQAPGWSVPIGRPLNHLRVYVVDGSGSQVPVGFPGELWVGGVGLARGYNRRPAATASVFVPDALGGQFGGRLYRTGDRVRLLSEGNLEFLGRLDKQVKVRGVRVEPGEVEGVLAQHPDVAVVAVVARALVADNDLNLVAYFVLDEPGKVSEESLRFWAEKRLPSYLIPSRLVELEEIPRAPNGKIDRLALPTPKALGGGKAPGTLMEELLAGIWAEVLGLERVGVEDDFFELGGHSLLATQVASRLREVTSIDLPLRTLLTEPTVSAQARILEEVRDQQEEVSKRPPLVPLVRDFSVPLSHAQQRLWFLQKMEPESHAFNIPVAVRLSGPLDPEGVRRAFLAIVERHEILRTVYGEEGGRPMQQVLPEANLDFAFLEFPGHSESDLAAAMEGEVRKPFDLAAGPVLRVRLYRLEAEEHAALMVLHHIAGDAWSTAILVRELAAFYRAEQSGEPVGLDDLPVQYADFAIWQRRWLAGELLEQQVDFWRRQLEGASPLLEMPTDRPRPQAPAAKGRILGHGFPQPLGDGLRALARREGATLFMVLMAAFKVLLYARTENRDLVVGTDIANRNHLGVEPLVGFFINQMPLRTQVEPEAPFSALLRHVRETTFQAYAYQEVPFDKVVEAVRPERSLRYAPIFQVKMNLQNVRAEKLSVEGVELAPLELQTGTAQLDLILNLVDGRETLFGTIHYDVELFDEATVEGLWEDYEALLEALVQGSGDLVEDLAAGLRAASESRFQERQKAAESAGLSKLKRIRRRPVTSG